jgi:hypothetical protein
MPENERAVRLRSMLLAGDPGPPWRYGSMMIGTLFDGHQTGMIIQPTNIREGALRGVRFVFGGLMWFYLVMGQKPSLAAQLTVLQTNGRFPLTVGDLKTAPFFVQMMDKRPRR